MIMVCILVLFEPGTKRYKSVYQNWAAVRILEGLHPLLSVCLYRILSTLIFGFALKKQRQSSNLKACIETVTPILVFEMHSNCVATYLLKWTNVLFCCMSSSTAGVFVDLGRFSLFSLSSKAIQVGVTNGWPFLFGIVHENNFLLHF